MDITHLVVRGTNSQRGFRHAAELTNNEYSTCQELSKLRLHQFIPDEF